MNNIKNVFTIQDLENLSGIKAHTLRIWEKRYGILKPNRLNRNIREYDLHDLQKILNISVLYKHDFKVAQLSVLTDRQLAKEAQRVGLLNITNNTLIHSLLVAMYAFDESAFEKVYQTEISHKEFTNIFIDTYLPLLDHIGLLWQTDAIKPAHEHFISNLIYQKIVLNTTQNLNTSLDQNHVHVLYLPENEIHEIGLLFLNFHLQSVGTRTIYLGRSIPIDNLFTLSAQFQKITWVSYFTIEKSDVEKQTYLNQVSELLLNTNNTHWIIGSNIGTALNEHTPNTIVFVDNLAQILRPKQQ